MQERGGAVSRGQRYAALQAARHCSQLSLELLCVASKSVWSLVKTAKKTNCLSTWELDAAFLSFKAVANDTFGDH